MGDVLRTWGMKAAVIFALVFGFVNMGEAYTGPISLAGINLETNANEYLNSNGYRFLDKAYMTEFYVNADNSILVGLSKYGNVQFVDIYNPGPSTNRGIQVGMTLNDLKYAYGPIYSQADFRYNDRANTGSFSNVGASSYYNHVNYDYTKYTGYMVVTYQEPISSLQQGESADGVQFVVNRRNNRIALIHYYASMHKQQDLIMLADYHGLLSVVR